MQLSQQNLSFKKLYIGNSKEASEFLQARNQVQDILGASITNHLCERDARIIAAKNINPKTYEPIVYSEDYDAFVQPNQNKVEISLRHISTNKEIAQIELSQNNKNKLNYRIKIESVKDKAGSVINLAKSIMELIDKAMTDQHC